MTLPVLSFRTAAALCLLFPVLPAYSKNIGATCAANDTKPGVYWFAVDKSVVDFANILESRKLLVSMAAEALAATNCKGPGNSVYVIGINTPINSFSSQCDNPSKFGGVLKCINEGGIDGAYLLAYSSSLFGSGNSFVSAAEVRQQKQSMEAAQQRASAERAERAERSRREDEDRRSREAQRVAFASQGLQLFATKAGANSWMTPQIEKNPFQFEGKIVVFPEKLEQFVAKNKATFSFYNPSQNLLSVKNIDAKAFAANGWVYMAGRIDGVEAVNLGVATANVLIVSYVSHIVCEKELCSEFNGARVQFRQ